MAIVLRGRHNGTRVTLHQASDDWVSADLPDGQQTILNPTSIGFETPEERELVGRAAGHFWTLYEWTDSHQTRLRKKVRR